MNGNEPHLSGTGPTKSNHAIGRSGRTFDHNAHRQELFGKWAEEARAGQVEVEEPADPEPQKPVECDQCGGRFDDERGLSAHQARWCESDGSGIEPEEAATVYELYWTTDMSQFDLSDRRGHSQQSISEIINRKGRFEAYTREIADRLGYPEERDWDAGQPRKVDAA